MDKPAFNKNLKETADPPRMIHGIFNWCDRWCERCSHTRHCTVYQTAPRRTNGNADDFCKSLAALFDATMDVLKEQAQKAGLDFNALQDMDMANDLERKKYAVRNNSCLLLAKQYGRQVNKWFDAFAEKEAVGMEIRLQDPMLSDCLEVIRWYQYFLEVKTARALMSQKEEEEEHSTACDSLGNAKAVLVSLERSIGAWGYLFQKITEDEDPVLAILVDLQKLCRQVERQFPEARNFIRPGLDER
jgi:hypothetical protein